MPDFKYFVTIGARTREIHSEPVNGWTRYGTALRNASHLSEIERFPVKLLTQGGKLLATFEGGLGTFTDLGAYLNREVGD